MIDDSLILYEWSKTSIISRPSSIAKHRVSIDLSTLIFFHSLLSGIFTLTKRMFSTKSQLSPAPSYNESKMFQPRTMHPKACVGELEKWSHLVTMPLKPSTVVSPSVLLICDIGYNLSVKSKTVLLLIISSILLAWNWICVIFSFTSSSTRYPCEWVGL